eukprot:365866-Chlamydomonas_euryale.AAC.6
MAREGGAGEQVEGDPGHTAAPYHSDGHVAGCIQHELPKPHAVDNAKAGQEKKAGYLLDNARLAGMCVRPNQATSPFHTSTPCPGPHHTCSHGAPVSSSRGVVIADSAYAGGDTAPS